ncbi:penicillin-binding protein 2 [Patescibacteria group bacterium]|nr:penicillin-binding protein 2 [Patescibacteria group bacterium]
MKRFNPFDIYGSSDDIRDDHIGNYTRNASLGNDLPDSKYSASALKVSVELSKLRIFFLILLVGILILLSRSIWFQVVRGAYYREASEGNRIRIETIKARRGVIYDRNGELLVRNVPNFALIVIPADLPESESEKSLIFESISRILDIPSSEIEKMIEDVPSFSYEPIIIKEYIDYEKALLFQIESNSMAGVSLTMRDSREYTNPLIAAHTVGYTGKISEKQYDDAQNGEYLITDYVGKIGLEYFYEELLKGVDGKKRIEVDSLGKEKKIVASQEAVSGSNLTLTLDIGLQKVLYDSISNAMSRSGAPGGSAVALDPRTGEVLAIVNTPSFDTNVFSKGIPAEEFSKLLDDPSNPLFMRSITGQYPSGSTIKPVIAAAALQEGIITGSTTVLSTGGIEAGPQFFPDWKAGGHGQTDVRKAIADSVNTFFYLVGGGDEEIEGLGVERIVEYARLFGIGEKSNIDLPGESTGFLPTKDWKLETKGERWYLGDTYHLAIGQGDILVTPLQVANFIATIANGGTLYQPFLVQSVNEAKSNVTSKIQPVVIRENFINSAYLKIVREGLRQAVTSGSASGLQNLQIAAAGKTGTAQFGPSNKTHAWFVGFAPYDTPEIVVVVLIEEGGEGSTIALPIARDALQWYFNQE